MDKYFVINGSSEPDLADIEGGNASLLTYIYTSENFNDNGNFEEVVKIKYGNDKWLRFTSAGGKDSLTLTNDSTKASTFYWTYLKPEYYLLNNGDYPSRDHLEFGYNKLTVSSVTTRYKAYRIYSMLVDTQLTYCGRKDETRIDSLTSDTRMWKTNYTITRKYDRRFSDGASGLSVSTDAATLVTTVTPSGSSP